MTPITINFFISFLPIRTNDKLYSYTGLTDHYPCKP